MKKITSYYDFIQLIKDGESGGYQVCLESANFQNENWDASRYIDYLSGIEHQKDQTGATIYYDSFNDCSGRVYAVDVTIHFPQEKDLQERNYLMHWVVKR